MFEHYFSLRGQKITEMLFRGVGVGIAEKRAPGREVLRIVGAKTGRQGRRLHLLERERVVIAVLGFTGAGEAERVRVMIYCFNLSDFGGQLGIDSNLSVLRSRQRQEKQK
ncbi:MAG: hypothetical protein QOD80_2159 [Verrucomicrobiota bacterium]